MKRYLLDQGKSLDCEKECTVISPTVRLTAYAPWTLRFWPCRTLDWVYTVPVTKKVDGKPTIYRRGLSSFTMAKNRQTPGISVLPYHLISNYQLTPDWGKSLNRKNVYGYITNSEIDSLGTFNATFPALLHTQLTVYSTSDEQGWWKSDNLS